MDGHDDGTPVLSVNEDVMAAANAVELPTRSLQRTDEVAWCDGRKPLAHPVWTTTCTRSPAGTDHPRSLITSRYPSIASLAIAKASSRVSPSVTTSGRSGTKTVNPPSS